MIGDLSLEVRLYLQLENNLNKFLLSVIYILLQAFSRF